MLGDVLLHFGLAGVALAAVKGFEHPLHLVIRVLAHGGLHVVARQLEMELALFLADFGDDLLLELDDLLHLLMGEQDGLQHDFLGNLVRAGFHHQNRFLGSGRR